MVNYKAFRKGQTELQLSYLTGFIEGEGCFYVGHIHQPNLSCSHHWHTMITISNNEKRIMDWLEEIFGRKSAHRYRYRSKRKNEHPTYRFSIGGQMLDYILLRLYSYFIIKKPPADIMLELRKTFYNRGSKDVSNEETTYRFELMKKMRSLNTRFHDHPLKY